MSTMLAAVLVSPHHFELQERPIPVPAPGELLVKVSRCGVCGTDLHIFHGHYSADRLPLVPGHEFVGTIAAIGSPRSAFAPGQRVVADINIGCGHCFYCRRNEILNCTEMQQLGIHRDGAFADYVVVPERLAIAVPDHLPDEIAALTEPLACVVRGAKKIGLRFTESVLVLGAGPIGNLHVQIARTLGAGPVIAVDLDPTRLDLARRCGADAVISDPAAVGDIVRGLTGGRGADVVIESVGLASLYQQAFTYVRPGGRVLAFGITSADARLSLSPLEVVLRETGLKGSVAGMGEDMHEALALLSLGRINTAPFTQTTLPLAKAQDALELFARDRLTFKVQLAA